MKTTINKQIEIVVNLGNYQSIRLTSGKTVEDDPSVTQAQLTDELAKEIRLSLTKTLQILSKKTDAPEKFAEACQTKLSGGTAATQTQPKT